MLARLWDKGHTPVNVQHLKTLLERYPDIHVANELLCGFTTGFRLQYTGPRFHSISKKIISAFQYKEETMKKLKKEINMGRMLGPFAELPISTLRISPIGLVPKSDGTWRLITNLSYPHDNSVNTFIDDKFCKVKYSTFDDILDKIYDLGPRALLGKIDIKSAFRLLIVHPADFDLLGIKFEGEFYIDKCLPMGCSLSCNLFEKCSTFLQWAVEFKSGLHSIDHYLDDFIFMGCEHSDDCSRLMEIFMDLSKELGVPIVEEKTVEPIKVLSFLVYVIDTELMMVYIPQNKLAKLHSLLIPMLHKQKMFVRQLESVTGLLAFCSRAIPASRAFIRRFYDLIAGVKNKPHYKVRLNNEVKSDVLLLLEMLDKFNGH